uniref:Zinc finger protein 414 n=1 Tax=Anas platyrhynchos TaxID=8839 RepID=A0A8B9TLC5_ANAPL
RHHRQRTPGLVPATSQAMKTEKDEASAPLLAGGGSAWLAPCQVVGSGGAPTQDLRLLKRRPASGELSTVGAMPRVMTGAMTEGQCCLLLPGKHYACSSYGCKLAFPSMQELMDHLKVHYRPTQSLEGKTFQCPTLGCMETFPSMQDLMAHMKVHYKPNRYFKCENCLLRFRTHRSLFKHLHVCSDRAGSPAPPQKAEKPVPPATSALEKELPAKAAEGLPKLPSIIQHTEKEAIIPGADTAPAAPATLPPRLRPFVPSHGPPVSNAIWKKSQGEGGERPLGGCDVPQRHASNSRIVWEHTRGRYTCMQCPYSTASREEMTLHIEDHRKNLPPPGRLDADMGTALGGNREDAGGPSRVPTCSH